MMNNVDIEELNHYVGAYTETSAYDAENLLTFDWYSERIIRLSPGGDLLELGLGHGATVKKFSSAYNRHIIIEGSDEVIEHFRRTNHDACSKIVHDLFEEYESDILFDVIVMGFILEHVDDPEVVLKRYRRFMKPSGFVYAVVPNARSLHRRIGREAGLLPDFYQLSDYDRKAGHKRYFDIDSIKRLLEISGYKVNRVEGLFLKPFTTAQLVTLNLSSAVLRGMFEIGMAYPELSNALLIQACMDGSLTMEEPV